MIEGGNAEAANVALRTEDSLSKEEKGHPLALGNSPKRQMSIANGMWMLQMWQCSTIGDGLCKVSESVYSQR